MQIPVHSDRGDYNIVLLEGSTQEIGRYLNLDRKVLVVTDSGVPKAYSERIAAACRTPVSVCIPMGETGKSLEQYQRLLSVMLENGFGRGDCVVAVGGGVVGDLSGFAASCYMRGVDFYNVPTTLLSQVDSSIGGKTAVNFEGVKNIVGTFYPPKAVVIDPSTLQTLDERQLHAGLAEVIKMAATSDADLFRLLEESEDFRADLTEIIRRALLIKRDVVEKDPTEKGLRRVLNFGHTIGHAIEGCGAGRYLHGECVAMGMIPFCGPAARQRLIAVLEKVGLPTAIPYGKEQLMPFLVHDKKKTGNTITTVFVEQIGSFTLRDRFPEEILSEPEGMA